MNALAKLDALIADFDGHPGHLIEIRADVAALLDAYTALKRANGICCKAHRDEVAELIEAMDHVAVSTAYQDCDTCCDLCVYANEQLARAGVQRKEWP